MPSNELRRTQEFQDADIIRRERQESYYIVSPASEFPTETRLSRLLRENTQSTESGPVAIAPRLVVSGQPEAENIQPDLVTDNPAYLEPNEIEEQDYSAIINSVSDITSEKPLSRLFGKKAVPTKPGSAAVGQPELVTNQPDPVLDITPSTQPEMVHDQVTEQPLSEGYTREQQEENVRTNFPEPEFDPKSLENISSIGDSPLLSRRKFIIGAGLGLAATSFGFGYLTKFKLPDLGKILPSSENEQPKAGTMVLGEEEQVFQDEMIGYASWTPDGPITYYETANGKRRYLLTGGQDNATYMLESDGTKTLKEIMASGEINEQSFKKVYGPDQNVKYRREYAGITGVLQIDKGNKDHLLGIAHCEERTSRDASGDYTSTIGLTESFDGGLSWIEKGPLIVGTDVKAPGGGRVSGAGQPTVVLNEKDGYAYIMYIDWSAKGNHPDQLYLARTKANDNGTLGNTEYYTEAGFSDFKPELKPVIPVPEGSNLVYTALPHLSWNTEMKQYMCTGESDNGFWMATSPDLLNWSKPEIVYDFTQRGGKPHSILQAGQKWDSYPTALDESKENSQITGKNGIFYHSSGDNIVPHVPATVDFTIVS